MGVSLGGSAKHSVSHFFSPQHLTSAKLFRGLAIGIESKDVVDEAEKTNHRAFVTGAVIFSVCHIEAAINELYTSVSGDLPLTVGGRVDPKRALLTELWEVLEKYPTLTKYQVVLAACGCPVFEKDRDPYQATGLLIRVRNALIHYRPERSHALDEHKKLRDRLSNRFPDNRLAEPGCLWFPHLCLGAGCAAWAVATVESFMADFRGRLEIPMPR